MDERQADALYRAFHKTNEGAKAKRGLGFDAGAGGGGSRRDAANSAPGGTGGMAPLAFVRSAAGYGAEMAAVHSKEGMDKKLSRSVQYVDSDDDDGGGPDWCAFIWNDAKAQLMCVSAV